MLTKSFNNCQIRVRESDKYISLTDMAKATGKRVNNWTRQPAAQEFVSELSRIARLSADVLIQKSAGNYGEASGTWAHPDIAIQFAQWCNPKFAAQVSLWVRELLATGSVKLKDSIDPVTGEIKELKQQYEELEKKLEEVERYWEAEQILRIKAQGKMRKAKNMLKENIADTEYYSSLVDNYKDYLRYNHGDLATAAKVVNWVAEFYRSYGGNCEKVEDMEEVSTGLLKRTLIVMKSVQDAGVLKEEHAKELRGIVREASRKGLL